MSEPTPAPPSPPPPPLPPPLPPAASSASSASTSSRAGVSTGVTRVLAAVGAIAVFITIFLSWLSFDVGSDSVSEKGTDVPVQFLWDTIPADDDPSLLVVLAPIAVLMLIAALAPRLRVLALVGGVLAIVGAVLFVVQTGDLLDELHIDLGAFDAIGVGPYLAVAGGVAGVVAGVVPRSD